VSALEEFSGSRAGLSASAVGRLTTDWQNERRAFADRDLSSVDHVYLWVDGAHFTVHPGHRRVRADGSKELVVFVDGYRKSLSRGRTCCATAAACRTYEMPFVSHHIGPSASPILVPRKGILTSRRLTIHDRWWIEAKPAMCPVRLTVIASPTGASSSGLRRTRRGPVRDVLAPTLRPRRGVVFS